MTEQPTFDLRTSVEVPLEPILRIALREYSGGGVCTTCGSGGVRAVYHEMLHEDQRCGREFWWANQHSGWLLSRKDFPPHLCRACPTCRNEWCESLVPDDVLRVLPESSRPTMPGPDDLGG